jgi:UDP-glucuronate 4-epimerase
MKVLVTGAAGFIGFHVARKLLARGDEVVGVDSLNDYYDPTLKAARLELLKSGDQSGGEKFSFRRGNLADSAFVTDIFAKHSFDRVIHLAAQAGVRYSLDNPAAYVESNVVAFLNVLEACRHERVSHLTYASTSSVYGANTAMPFTEKDGVDHPLQFYAATKRANELMAHSYSHLFRLPTTGLRFFTVYGPWGRPDMALFKFTKSILEGKPIQVFNGGLHKRDFTYVDDIAEGVVRVSDRPASADPSWNSDNPRPDRSSAPFRVLNIGNGAPVDLLDFVRAIERTLGKKAIVEYLPLQPGDVPETFADVSELGDEIGFRPSVTVDEGIERFVAWYRGYYNV